MPVSEYWNSSPEPDCNPSNSEGVDAVPAASSPQAIEESAQQDEGPKLHSQAGAQDEARFSVEPDMGQQPNRTTVQQDAPSSQQSQQGTEGASQQTDAVSCQNPANDAAQGPAHGPAQAVPQAGPSAFQGFRNAPAQSGASQQGAAYTGPASQGAVQTGYAPQGTAQPGSAYRSAPQPGPVPQAPSQMPPQYGYAGQYPNQPAYAQPAPAKKSHGWIVAIVTIVCLFAFTAFCVNACVNAAEKFGIGSYGYSYDDLTEDTVGVIDIDGTIQYDGTLCSPEGFKEMLDEAEGNDHIKAVVLRVNSGGGTATAGEEMAEYLKDFSKPVVVSSASINASAAYEISAQADYVFVAKSTEIGAIGTAMQVTDLSGLLEKLGVKMDVIVSADSKDSSYGFRPLTKDEREYYQRMIDQINEMFIENVAEGRKMKKEDVRKLATGLIFTGVDAVKNGLADKVGTREDALDKAAELAGITEYDTVQLQFDDYYLSDFAGLLGESKITVDDIVEILGSQNQGHLK